MAQIPQTTEKEAADLINALIVEHDRFHDWNSPAVVQIRDALTKLQKVAAREAFSHWGAIAAMCGRLEDLAEFYRKARLLPEKQDTDDRFVGCFTNAALYSQAYGILGRLLDPRLGFFPKHWRAAVSRGHVLEVAELWSLAEKTYPNLREEDRSLVMSAAKTMRERGLSDSDIVTVLDLMGEIQRLHRVMFFGKELLTFRVITEDPDAPYLYGTVFIDAPIDEVQAMNRKLSKLIVERIGAFPSGLVMAFRKAPARDQLAAAA